MSLLDDHYLIIINGPSGSGKDTIANIIYDHRKTLLIDTARFSIERMSMPLKYFANYLTHNKMSDDGISTLELHKKTKLKNINNLSYEELQQHISHFISQSLGSDFLGRHLAMRLSLQEMERVRQAKRVRQVVIIPDAGVQAETDSLLQMINPKNCLVIHVQRDKHEFNDGIRSYIYPRDATIATYKNNTLDPSLAIIALVKQWFRTQNLRVHKGSM